VLKLRRHPGRKKVQRMLARYLDAQVARRLYSDMSANPALPSPHDFMELGRAPSATADHDEGHLPAPPQEPTSTGDDEDDELEAYRQLKNWSSYHDK
jgi:hypothetical protein